MAQGYSIPAEDETIGLWALGWIVGEPRRAERMLALTGLSADGLRTALADPAQIGALLGFLVDHEPDLIACAADIGTTPERIVAARRALGGGQAE